MGNLGKKVGIAETQILIESIKIEWDLTNGPLRKLLELLDTQV